MEKIEGINPLHITRITRERGRRRGGMHPMARRLYRKRHPLLKYIWSGPEIGGWNDPTVYICVTGGRWSTHLEIEYKSNAEMNEYADYMDQKLESFLRALRNDIR